MNELTHVQTLVRATRTVARRVMQWRDDTIQQAYGAKSGQTAWQWNAAHVDYSRAPNYDTPYRGPFDPELMPFWKQPLEDAHDPNVREIAVLKASRCGFSENCLLADQRFVVAEAPEPTLYVTGKMDLAKGFLDRRVVRGMGLAAVLADKFKAARTIGTDIQFADMDFRATWASSDTATKQDGWARIHADEVSLWDEFTVDMVRRRCAAYPFHHIIFGGSIDPTRRGNPAEDPTLKLYQESDQHVWVMPDPKTGRGFTFELAGIRWPDSEKHYENADGCDLDAVEAGAWYETPEGTRIADSERMGVVRRGWWESRNPGGIRRGYKVVALMVPFADCTFGAVAKRFLSAKHRMNLAGSKGERQRNTLRTYFAEMWAEAHHDEQIVARDTSLVEREADYAIGDVFVPKGYIHNVLFTSDVQKFHYWWLARVWSLHEKSGAVEASLLDYGTTASIVDLDAIAADIKPEWVGMDIGYELKQTEVGAYCASYTDQRNPEETHVIALRGSDSLKAMRIDRQVRDAYEGSKSAGRALFFELTFRVDDFRTMLLDAMNGEKGAVTWWVPKRRKEEARWRGVYVKQVTSTRKLDGEWVEPGHRQDHLWDCETMQFVLAGYMGLVK